MAGTKAGLEKTAAAAGELVEEFGDRAGQVAAARLEDARAVLAELADRAGPVLAERAEQAREELSRRWHELEEDLPLDTDTLPQQLERGLWQVVRSALGVLLVLPRVLVRGLGAFGELAEDVGDRGLVAGERAKELAAAIPPSRRERRRRRVRTAAWTGAGFGFGLVVGWLLGRQDRPQVVYEPADLGAHLDAPATGPVAVPTDPPAAPIEPEDPAPEDPAPVADAPDTDDAPDDEARG